MMDSYEDLSFEAAVEELEATIGKLEAGDLPLEEALVLFEKGQELARICSIRLESAALRVERLTSNGELVELPID
jgi:exodeoxyribonuclease VII small subunit